MERKPRRESALEAILRQAQEKHPTDVLGSWTGVPWPPRDAPVQDADDL